MSCPAKCECKLDEEYKKYAVTHFKVSGTCKERISYKCAFSGKTN